MNHHHQKRTYQPVRRNSHHVQKHGKTFWKSVNSKDLWEIVRAAERFDTANKEAGRKSGPIGSIGLDILRLFARLVDHKTGRLEPSYSFICQALRRSRDAVNRALQALKATGFLDVLRRYTETGNEGKGPQIRQVSNAYRLQMPRKAVDAFKWLSRHIPKPDDATQALAARQAERQAQEASLSREQYARHVVDDEPLAMSLAALGRALALKRERESVMQGEQKP